jgi:hypothetical protein
LGSEGACRLPLPHRKLIVPDAPTGCCQKLVFSETRFDWLSESEAVVISASSVLSRAGLLYIITFLLESYGILSVHDNQPRKKIMI